MTTNFSDLFNPQIQSDASVKLASNEYRPNPKNAKNGKYTAIIRFVPWVGDPSKSLMEKYISWVFNPTTQERRCIDNPRTWGEGRNPITDTYFLCQRTNRPDIQELGKKCISTRQQFTCLVQIIRDNEHPELQGKILVWKFGKTIYDKIENERNPQIGVGTNPFDPIHGRYFSLVITTVSNFPNYDQCNFVDYHGENGETSGIWWVNPQTNAMEIATEASMSSDENRNAFADYLRVASPDLTKYDYSHWNEEDTKFVNNIVELLTNVVNQGFVSAQPANPAVYSSMPSPAPASPIVISSPALPFENIPISQPSHVSESMQQREPMPEVHIVPLADPAVSGVTLPPAVSGVTLPKVTPLAPQTAAANSIPYSISSLDDVIAKI